MTHTIAPGALARSLAATSLLAATLASAADSPQRIRDADREPGNWLTYGRTYSEQRFSPLPEITTANVNRLGLAWAYDIDEPRPVEGTPLVVDGVMYATGAWSKIYAIDAATGRELWRFDPEVDKSWESGDCCKAVNRGAAYWNGKLFVGTVDGRLIAVDIHTGRKIWQQQTATRDQWPYTITGAPRVVKGRVIIGNSGADLGVRGYVTAYEAETGRQAWRFYTVPGNPADGFENKAMAIAAKTWSGEWWKYGGGGTVWESIVADPDLNLVYIGVGNGSPWNRKVRSPGGGDNLFLTSIVALRIDTGEYVWHYQTVPGEEWDYTSTQPMMLADLRIQGRLRKVLMQAPKNGFFYVLDRATGQFISAKNHVPVNWAFGIDAKTGRPDVNPAARYPDGKLVRVQPASTGGHGWSPMAFDPHTGLVYFSSTINSNIYGNDPEWYRFEPGYINTGACTTCKGVVPNPALPLAEPATFLLAWDPVRQAPAWRVQRTAVRDGGVLATGGDVVFQGSGDGVFYAHDAGTGEQLWAFAVQNAALTGPISYAVHGAQYIALPVGQGYSSQLQGPIPYPALLPNTNRILAFKLDAHGTLPPVQYTPQSLPEPPPLTAASDDTVAHGHAVFNRYCFVCHGFDATGEGVHPDLRFSNVLPSAAKWAEVVVDGVRKDNGMVGFGPVVDRETAEAIRAFVISQAHAAKNLAPAVQREARALQ